VADLEGRARIKGVVASIHDMDCHGNKVAEDAILKTPCVVIIFNEAPRYREVQSKPESKHPNIRYIETGRAAQQRRGRRHVLKQDLPWRANDVSFEAGTAVVPKISLDHDGQMEIKTPTRLSNKTGTA